MDIPQPALHHPEKKSTTERVLSVRSWTPTLISLRITRDPGFSFTAGQYTRLGFSVGDSILWRPYSMISAVSDDFLEFVIVLVETGISSEHVKRLQVGDEVQVDKKSHGFLTTEQLAPGQDLWLLSSGTGIGPFLSILREPALWQAFLHIILVHSVRHSAELVYRDEMTHAMTDPLFPGARFCYLPIVTREPGVSTLTDRIPQLLTSGRLEEAATVPITLAHSRVMICGNPDMVVDVRQLLSLRGFLTTRKGILGQMVLEKYW